MTFDGKKYREENRDKLRENGKKYYRENKERIEERRRKHIESHRDEYRKRAREYVKKHEESLRQYRKEYYLENKEHIDAKSKAWGAANKERKHEQYMKWRVGFFDMYGNVCACCGESIQEFLTIEHIQGREKKNGKSKQTATTDYKIAIQEYRPDLYETLCMNCNHAKGRFGICPHETIKTKE